MSSKSIWGPLKYPLFRALWIAALFSNVGTWMHDVGAAWLMTSLTQSPLMVSLLQTAIYLPFFLMALPAGAMADVFDRRRLLLFGHVWMLVAAVCLGLFSISGATTPWLLIACTFALGLGASVSAPAWNAVTPELVPRKQLQSAIALGGVSFNLARGVGSVLGGIMITLAGTSAVFFVNALSFVGLIVFFLRWERQPQDNFRHGERVVNAIRAGLRYVRHAPALVAVLIRSALFAIAASAVWALLPLICREKLGFSAIEYGIALGLFGLGTLGGASLLPRVRRRLSLDQCSAVGTVMFAASVVALACAPSFTAAALAMVGAGASWILVNSCLNLAVQLAVPQWVRARALAFYILVCQGSVAAGAIMWGAVASQTDLVWPLLASALALILGLTAIARFPLVAAEQLDVTQSKHWDQPDLVFEPEPEHGPVLVSVEYLIDPERASEFAQSMDAVRLQRLRDGAFQWHLFHDLSNRMRFLETYFVESWAEHMRQHERVTVTDRLIEDRAVSFHLASNPPVVDHFISAYAERRQVQEPEPESPEAVPYQNADYRFMSRM